MKQQSNIIVQSSNNGISRIKLNEPSTYNALSLNSKQLAITPISAFRPRRWKGKIVSSSSLIKIKNLNNKKRPVSVVADNVEVRNINNVKIRVNNHIKFKLLYDSNNSLTKKIKLEQFRNR